MHNKEALLIVNSKAGKGNAVKLAREINQTHNLKTYEIADFFALNIEQKNQLLSELSYIFILGGDGSSFSLINLLLSLNLLNQITVIPLGLGGENVLAKNLGIHGRSFDSVEQVFMGNYTPQILKPLSVQLINSAQENEIEMPFSWNVHAGFSAGVLYEIEQLRNIGASDFKRRYLSTFKTFLKLRGLDPVVFFNNGKSQKVLDFGVISSLLPCWTSKFTLPTTKDQIAILNTIQGHETLQYAPGTFYSRFIIELISLKLGLPISRKILVQEPLNSDFNISVESPSGIVAVDSEIYQAKLASMHNHANFPGSGKILLPKLSK